MTEKTTLEKNLTSVQESLISDMSTWSEEEMEHFLKVAIRKSETVLRRKPVKAIEWNNCPDKTISRTHAVNQKNSWVTDRINVVGDRVSWTKMSKKDQIQFIKTFVILSRIDAEQGLIGMDELADNCPCPYTAAVYKYQGGIEIIHSESYNRQLATFISTAEEMKYIEWAKNSKEVDNVVSYLINNIINVKYEETQEVSNLLQTAYSTVLESYLFFLLFYYPLYEANVRNRMTRCAEVIRLILRDESVHGAFSGYKFREGYAKLSDDDKVHVTAKIEQFMEELYGRVETMLRAIYEDEFIIADIQRFANFNFNRTLNTLGYEPVFSDDECKFHSALYKEVDEGTDVTHDIFSMVGNVYFMMKREDFKKENMDLIAERLENRSEIAPKPYHTNVELDKLFK